MTLRTAAAVWSVIASGALLSQAPACAQSAPRGALIYTCTDAAGKKLTSDRPIPACTSREQRVLNSDGSLNRIIPPTMTAIEQGEDEVRQRELENELKARREAVKRDQSLARRFPTEAAHRKAREAALEDVHKAMRTSEERLAVLAKERKPLMEEAEFYAGKPLPPKLKNQLDANDASVDALRALKQNQQLEEVRIDLLFDAELERLKKLWAGVPAGSLASTAASASALPRR